MMRLVMLTIIWMGSCLTATAQVYRVAQMNTQQIRGLDKQKTVVILTGGILEEHGPHLPSYTDTYVNEWLTERLAEAIVARPGWAALIFPTIPLGHAGANEIGGLYVFPGTYSVRRSTVRAIYMDLATQLGEQGFRWIFINHGHGGPYNNLMLDQAGEYFRDTYGGTMVHLRGLEPTEEQLRAVKFTEPMPPPAQNEVQENGKLDIHAGFEETSVILFLRPDLVGPTYKQLSPLTVNSREDQFRLARTDGWLGYLGSPRLANANYGARRQIWRARLVDALALAILDRVLDERDIPRFSKRMIANKDFMKELVGSDNYDAEVARKQREWMEKKGIQ